MKFPLVLVAGVCLLFAAVPVMADQAEDEAAIRQAREKRIAAYNTQNAKLVGETIVEDVEDWAGNLKGKDAGIKALVMLFESAWKDLRITQLEEIGIQFITPDVAVFKSRQVYSGILDETGKTAPSMEVLFAEIYVKKNGKWLAHSWYWQPTEQ
jgi:uncharacterized protein (TIGR02246 family)